MCKRNENYRRLAASSFALVALAAASAPALAQEQGATAGDVTQEADQASGGLEDIVVTARKSAERLQSIPVSVTALSGDTLIQANVSDTMNIAKLAPGLVAQPGGLTTSEVYFTIRGMSAAAFGEASVGVYVDGVYRQTQGGLNSAVADLERVEVLKGPQGTLYGKNTSGGVVNLITKKPVLDELSGYVTASGGAYLASGVSDAFSERVEGAINLPIVEGKLAGRIMANYNHDDGFGRDGNGRRLANRNDPFVRGHLLFEPNDRWQFLLSADYGVFRSNGFLRPLSEVSPGPVAIATGVAAGLINPADIPSAANGNTPGATFGPGLAAAIGILSRDVNRTNFYRENATSERYSKFKAGGVSLTVDGDLADNLHLKSVTAYRGWRDKNANDVDGSQYHVFEASFSNDAKFWSQEINLSGKLFDGRLDWLAGGFYSQYRNRRGDLPNVGTVVLTPLTGAVTVFDSRVYTESVGGFGHAVFHATDKLSLTGGLRWSKDNRSVIPMDKVYLPDVTTLIACQVPGALVSNGCVSPKVRASFSGTSYEGAINYEFNDGLMIYATTRRGFRSGDFNTNGTYQPYQPETATDYELGVKSEWFDRHLLVNVAAYQTNYRDIQRSVTVFNTLPGGGLAVGTAVQNAASARIRGVEVELRAQLADGLTIGGAYTYTNAKYLKFLVQTAPGVFDDRSDEVFGVPKNSFNISADYTYDFASEDSLKAHLGVFWQDDQIFGGSIALLPSEPILRQDAYALFDARLTYENKAGNFSVALFARNLFNKKFNSQAGDLRPIGITYLVPGTPRFVGLELTKRFGR